jgi:ankyrin repeat protein
MFGNFLTRTQDYTHQLDNQLRTCLIYAVQYNSANIVEKLLELGVNVDAKDSNGCTALIYAILNNNYGLAKRLLKAGASPWSCHDFDMKPILESCDEQIKVAVKNTRKLHIGMKLCSKKMERAAFWSTHKERINGEAVLHFG